MSFPPRLLQGAGPLVQGVGHRGVWAHCAQSGLSRPGSFCTRRHAAALPPPHLQGPLIISSPTFHPLPWAPVWVGERGSRSGVLGAEAQPSADSREAVNRAAAPTESGTLWVLGPALGGAPCHRLLLEPQAGDWFALFVWGLSARRPCSPERCSLNAPDVPELGGPWEPPAPTLLLPVAGSGSRAALRSGDRGPGLGVGCTCAPALPRSPVRVGPAPAAPDPGGPLSDPGREGRPGADAQPGPRAAVPWAAAGRREAFSEKIPRGPSVESGD